MWQDARLLSNKSSGLYREGSPLKALAAETFKIGLPSIAIVWLLVYTFELEIVCFLLENQVAFTLNKC